MRSDAHRHRRGSTRAQRPNHPSHVYTVYSCKAYGATFHVRNENVLRTAHIVHDPRTPTHKRGSVCKSEVKSQARPPRKPHGATNAPHRHSICNKTLSRVLVHALPFPIRSPLISPSPGHTRQRPKTAEAVISPEHAPGCRRSIRTGTL